MKGVEDVVVVVVVIQVGHAGWGGGGALNVLLFLPSTLEPPELKRFQNEGWSLVSGQPNSDHFTLPLPQH